MLETALVATTTLFATIGPLDVAALFAVLTTNHTPAQRRRLALRGAAIGGAILLFFAFLGEKLLSSFGVSLAALRTGGGILLLLIAVDLVFARSSGGTSATDDERLEARSRHDVSVFPIGTPLIAGPGAISASILLMSEAGGDIKLSLAVCGALLANVVFAAIMMLLASQVQRVFGLTGMQVISRIAGILLAALAVQFIFDGISQSGLVG